MFILDKESYYPLIDVNWWADNSVILARCSGALTVSSVKTLRNLLGKSCEWFESSPQVTSAHDGGFLSLEVRNVHKQIPFWNAVKTVCFCICNPEGVMYVVCLKIIVTNRKSDSVSKFREILNLLQLNCLNKNLIVK